MPPDDACGVSLTPSRSFVNSKKAGATTISLTMVGVINEAGKEIFTINSIEARRATSLIVAQEYSSGRISLERISGSL
jgi:hypothetical protein